MNFSNLNILVTGADGFIGSHLTEKLVELGANVKALAFYNAFNQVGWIDDMSHNTKKNLEILNGDIRDVEFINNCVKKIDIIFHLAALISIPYSYVATRSFIETNVIGTLNILDAAKKSQCTKLIFTSTSEVYGTAKEIPITETHILQAQSPYAASKISADHLIESYVKSFKLPAVILRPFNTYGPRQSEKAVIPSIIRQAVDPKILSLKTGNIKTKRDFNFVSDTVMAFIMLAKADQNKIAFGNSYNSGSGIAVPISEVLNVICDITNCKKKHEEESVRIRPENSEVELLVASAKKLNQLTNWSPKVPLKEGLKITIEWWQEKINSKSFLASGDYKF